MSWQELRPETPHTIEVDEKTRPAIFAKFPPSNPRFTEGQTVTGIEIQRPYLLFLGNAKDQLAAKTAQGILDWRPDWCLGQMRLDGCNADLKIKDMDFAQAAKAGAKTVIVGVANRGGVLSADWVDMLAGSLELGMDLASGLHQRLSDHPKLVETAKRLGRKLHAARPPTRGAGVGCRGKGA